MMVSIDYFSDLLCIWAYVAEIRLDEVRSRHGDDVSIDSRFVSIFGSTEARIGKRWATKGGFAGYARHVHDVASGFDHVEVHPDVWLRDVPAGSYGPHLFVKAAALSGTAVEDLCWKLRLAFFRDARDIGRLDVQSEIAGDLGLPVATIRERLADGSAAAALAEDHEAAAAAQVTGSPTFLLNEGRQKLYGNVGYRIIEANIQELLADGSDRASWC